MTYRYYTNNSIKATTGLVAAYNMIPSNGTLVDISGNGNNGTINGAISTKEGMKFDGVDDYVEIDSGLLDLGAKSTSFRIRTTQTRLGVIVGGFYEGTYNSIFINFGAIYYGFGAGDSLKTTQTINDGLWHSITLVIDSSKSGIARAKWYIDGSLDTTDSSTTTRVTSSTFIGARNNSGGYVNFEGELSDLRFYNYAFTPQQAKEYHNSFIKPVILEDWSGSAVGDVI